MSDVIARWSNAYKDMQNALDRLKTAQALLKEAENNPLRKEAAMRKLEKAEREVWTAIEAFNKAKAEKQIRKLGGTRRHRRKHRKTLRRK
jgi:hypothetical protein